MKGKIVSTSQHCFFFFGIRRIECLVYMLHDNKPFRLITQKFSEKVSIAKARAKQKKKRKETEKIDSADKSSTVTVDQTQLYVHS